MLSVSSILQFNRQQQDIYTEGYGDNWPTYTNTIMHTFSHTHARTQALTVSNKS